ncbi:MAG: hypothetical protein GY754_22825 [bacterium]|nr:hypothetical protein [bacterium]
MNFFKLILTGIIVHLLWSVPAPGYGAPAAKKRIAVLNFSANNIVESYTIVARDNIEKSFLQTNKYHMLEREMVRMVLKSSNCRETICAVKIGQSISADYVVYGSIDGVDEKKYIITVRVVDVNSSRIVFADAITCPSKKDILKKSINMGGKTAVAMDSIVSGKPVEYNDSAVAAPLRIHLSLSGAYLLPVSDFTQIVSGGFAASFSANIENLFISNLILGVGSGYYRLPGKNDTDSVSIIPLFFNCGYSFTFLDRFFVSPLLSFGAGYNSLTDNTGTGSSIEAILRAGLYLGYKPNSRHTIHLGSAYYAIVEREGRIRFISFEGGFGICF